MGRTEDQVRDSAETILVFVNSDEATSGTGQITTFNQLGFKDVSYKPDGWYLPKDKGGVAIILETKSEDTDLDTQKLLTASFLEQNNEIFSNAFNQELQQYEAKDAAERKQRTARLMTAGQTSPTSYRDYGLGFE